MSKIVTDRLLYIRVNKDKILLIASEFILFHLQLLKLATTILFHLQLLKLATTILLYICCRNVLKLMLKIDMDGLHYIQVNKYSIL